MPNWDHDRALRTLTQNPGLYGYASPFWYEVGRDGGIALRPGAEDPTVVRTLRRHGVPVVPTVTNGFDPHRSSRVLASPASRSAHVALLVELVRSKGYDGVDLDYESMAGTDRDRFSALVRELAAALHARGKVLTVAVHAKIAEPGTWSGSRALDYAAIGAAADRVRVMAYDYSWSKTPAGPIAPIEWVEAVTAFAVSQIPAHKVELGVSLYGYEWAGSAGASLTYEAIRNRMGPGTTPSWDAEAAEPSFTYVRAGKTHVVAYADARSVAVRLAVVDRHGLAGAAFWRLGGEDPAVWDAVRRRWGARTPSVAATTSTACRWLTPSRSACRRAAERIYGASA